MSSLPSRWVVGWPVGSLVCFQFRNVAYKPQSADEYAADRLSCFLWKRSFAVLLISRSCHHFCIQVSLILLSLRPFWITYLHNRHHRPLTVSKSKLSPFRLNSTITRSENMVSKSLVLSFFTLNSCGIELSSSSSIWSLPCITGKSTTVWVHKYSNLLCHCHCLQRIGMLRHQLAQALVRCLAVCHHIVWLSSFYVVSALGEQVHLMTTQNFHHCCFLPSPRPAVSHCCSSSWLWLEHW